jgi:hypothetical protein
MMNALDAFAETIDAETPVRRPDLMLPFGKLNDLMGLSRLEELENRWTSSGD